MKKITLLLMIVVAVLSCRENVVQFEDEISTGKIIVSSIPDGADIYFENNKTGKTTPDSLISVLPGTYTIKLKLTGYGEESVIVNLHSGQKRFITVNFRDIY